MAENALTSALKKLKSMKHIDHTDTISVVSTIVTMGAHHIEGPAVVDGAIEVYHFVIAYAIGPMAFVSMDIIYLLNSHRTSFR
jgi:hypothetical protein